MKEYILILMTVFMFSCGSNKEITSENVSFNTVAKGVLGGAGNEGITAQNLIITDNEAWTSLVNKMDSMNNVSNSFSEVAIDFSEFTVIAVFASVKNTGGYGLDVKVMANSEAVLVNVKELVPGVRDFVTMAITQPYYIVKIRKTDLPIIIEKATLDLP